MKNVKETKYTRVEYERRFLVLSKDKWMGDVEPYSKILKDKYLRNSRLRLRLLTNSDSNEQIIKLNKKFESDSPYFQTISRILLSPEEYKLFDSIEGDWLIKTRYYHKHLSYMFSIDVFEGELDRLILCEVEAESLEQLMDIKFPEYATIEVTQDFFFTGGNLCRVTHLELERKLAAFR